MKLALRETWLLENGEKLYCVVGLQALASYSKSLRSRLQYYGPPQPWRMFGCTNQGLAGTLSDGKREVIRQFIGLLLRCSALGKQKREWRTKITRKGTGERRAKGNRPNAPVPGDTLMRSAHYLRYYTDKMALMPRLTLHLDPIVGGKGNLVACLVLTVFSLSYYSHLL